MCVICSQLGTLYINDTFVFSLKEKKGIWSTEIEIKTQSLDAVDMTFRNKTFTKMS